MIKSTTTPVYIACDGKQFFDASLCESYEAGLLRDKLLNFTKYQMAVDWTQELSHDAAVSNFVNVFLRYNEALNDILKEHADELSAQSRAQLPS